MRRAHGWRGARAQSTRTCVAHTAGRRRCCGRASMCVARTARALGVTSRHICVSRTRRGRSGRPHLCARRTRSAEVGCKAAFVCVGHTRGIRRRPGRMRPAHALPCSAPPDVTVCATHTGAGRERRLRRPCARRTAAPAGNTAPGRPCARRTPVPAGNAASVGRVRDAQRPRQGTPSADRVRRARGGPPSAGTGCPERPPGLHARPYRRLVPDISVIPMPPWAYERDPVNAQIADQVLHQLLTAVTVLLRGNADELGLDPTMLAIVDVLGVAPELSVAALADRIALSHAATSRAVSRLEARDWVTRVAETGPRRLVTRAEGHGDGGRHVAAGRAQPARRRRVGAHPRGQGRRPRVPGAGDRHPHHPGALPGRSAAPAHPLPATEGVGPGPLSPSSRHAVMQVSLHETRRPTRRYHPHGCTPTR